MILRLLSIVSFALLTLRVQAQQVADTTHTSIRTIEVGNVDVLPGAIDTKGWLLTDTDIQTELEGAVQNLYNFKFDKAEKQFRSLRRRYPHHPMPYFLLGLSTWWKIIPTNLQTKQYDKIFYAYMDTAVINGEKLYEADHKNYEACFFLAASYGFAAHLHGERRDMAKAVVGGKRALEYLNKSQEANGLSPEFLFGQALVNYYAVWIGDTYPLLKPVLFFFPRGNRELGVQQLKTVAETGFYTGLEARYFLMKILMNEENKPAESLPVSRYLATNFPDNAYFQRFYALSCFNTRNFRECERVSREILDKLNRGMPGYEAISGRYATYYLGWVMQNRYKDLEKAAEYYQRCIVFAESTGETNSFYYLDANLNLANFAVQNGDVKSAMRYYRVVNDKAEHKSEMYQEARAYLSNNKRS
jgi:hypothetical protein